MISYQNGVFIGVLIVYLPALAIAALLAWRHGFGRSSGWLYLIIFSLIRLVGACFDLATISDPTNLSLYIGYSILENIGLSPLVLVSLGLLSRVITSINRSTTTILQPLHMRFIQLIVMVGLILGIVGGVNSNEDYTQNGNKIIPGTYSKASLALFIVAYVLVILSTIILSFSVSHAELGEKRLLLAVALALPFILVRLIYAIMSTFANNSNFNTVTGNVTILLCMSILMELAAVIIYEAIGITLRKVASVVPATSDRRERNPHTYEAPGDRYEMVDSAHTPKDPSVGHQVADFLGRRTIIGRLITGQRRR